MFQETIKNEKEGIETPTLLFLLPWCNVAPRFLNIEKPSTDIRGGCRKLYGSFEKRQPPLSQKRRS
jgi:hypothetical protein